MFQVHLRHLCLAQQHFAETQESPVASQSSAQPGQGPGVPLWDLPVEWWSPTHGPTQLCALSLHSSFQCDAVLTNTRHPLTSASRTTKTCFALSSGGNISQENMKHTLRLKEGKGNWDNGIQKLQEENRASFVGCQVGSPVSTDNFSWIKQHL